jgi:hypothetical protein
LWATAAAAAVMAVVMTVAVVAAMTVVARVLVGNDSGDGWHYVRVRRSR